MAAKDCPMCGEVMRRTVREITDRVPGLSQTKVTTLVEWVCPECDYFEEADGETEG
jgi:predicted RNA-binding Zn-ribbon protein involved in translation (DUF1610 family)